MPPTPFPAGKTIRQLKINTDRQFICVEKNTCETGMVFDFVSGEDSKTPLFKDSSGNEIWLPINWMAYYEPTEQEEWEPRKGDVVTVKGVVSKDFDEDEGDMLVRVVLEGDGESSYCLVEKYAINFLSRPPAPRKVTMAEVEAAMGGPVEILPD